MTGFLGHPISYFFLTFILSYALTHVVRTVALKTDFVSRPQADRWNPRIVALGGGFAIHAAVLVGMFVLNREEWGVNILPAYLGVVILGVIDDIWGVSPAGKLIVQAIAATYVASRGFVFPIPFPVITMVVTVVWIMGASNALNLIDNMDGVAAGCTTIAGIGLWWLLSSQGVEFEGYALLSLLMAAATLGFLVHNRPPAKIFMGDAGSLGLGFLLATLSTKLRLHHTELPAFLSAIPVLMLLIVPVFDMLLVIVARTSTHRPVTRGGRDHTSHRLVSLGLTEKGTLRILYAFGLLGLAVARLASQSAPTEFATVSIASLVVLVLFGIFLLDVAVYPRGEVSEKDRGEFWQHRILPIHAEIVIEIALDVAIVSLTWTSAHLIRFYDTHSTFYYHDFSVIPWLPYVITSKLVACFVFRLYRGICGSLSNRDVYQIFKASTLGTLILVAGVGIVTRLQDLSRIVIILDWLLTFVGLVAGRAAIGAMRRWFRKLSDTPLRAALLGSKDLLPLMAASPDLKEKAVEFSGLICTDAKEGQGILGPVSNIESILTEKKITILYVAAPQPPAFLQKLESAGIAMRYVRLQLV